MKDRPARGSDDVERGAFVGAGRAAACMMLSMSVFGRRCLSPLASAVLLSVTAGAWAAGGAHPGEAAGAVRAGAGGGAQSPGGAQSSGSAGGTPAPSASGTPAAGGAAGAGAGAASSPTDLSPVSSRQPLAPAVDSAATSGAVVDSGSGAAQAAARPRFERALALYRQGDYRAAVAELKLALELDPSGKDLYFNLAMVQERLGEPEDALDSWRHYRAQIGRAHV